MKNATPVRNDQRNGTSLGTVRLASTCADLHKKLLGVFITCIADTGVGKCNAVDNFASECECTALTSRNDVTIAQRRRFPLHTLRRIFMLHTAQVVATLQDAASFKVP